MRSSWSGLSKINRSWFLFTYNTLFYLASIRMSCRSVINIGMKIVTWKLLIHYQPLISANCCLVLVFMRHKIAPQKNWFFAMAWLPVWQACIFEDLFLSTHKGHWEIKPSWFFPCTAYEPFMQHQAIINA